MEKLVYSSVSCKSQRYLVVDAGTAFSGTPHSKVRELSAVLQRNAARQGVSGTVVLGWNEAGQDRYFSLDNDLPHEIVSVPLVARMRSVDGSLPSAIIVDESTNV